MKLSPQTMTVLKNFSTINESIFVKPGNVLETVSKKKNILARAEVADTFADEFGIYDLNNFLGVLTLQKADTPEIDIESKTIVIKGLAGRSKIAYRKAAKETIILPPDKKVNMGTPEIEFSLSAEDYLWIQRVASALSSPNIAISSDGTDIQLEALDTKDDSAHVNSTTIGKNDKGTTYRVVFSTENLKFIDGNYDVKLSSRGIGYFKNTSFPVEYWVSTEAASKF